MSGNKINPGNELPMDELLQAAASELPPPSETVEEISPWKKAVKQILFGLALQTVKLEFGMLDYILPLCGVFLLLLGFRSLRRENRHFGVGYVFTLLRTILCFSSFTLDATIWKSIDPIAQIIPWILYIGIAINMAIIICLRNGFVSVQRKAGVPVDAGNATALVVWYAVLSLSAFVTKAVTERIGTFENYSLISWCIIILLIIYVLILISYYRQSMKIMETSGYVIAPAPVRISTKPFCIILGGILSVCMTVTYIFFNQYPMNWTSVPASAHEEVQEIKANLLELGFPDYLLDSMTVEDILSCQDAVYVQIDYEERSLIDGKITQTEGEKANLYDLATAIVSVRLAGDHQWKFFHYFEWLTEPNVHRVDALLISPVYQNEQFFLPVGELGEISGRLLYDRDGETFSSSDYTSNCTVRQTEFLFTKSRKIDIVAGFSFPRDGEHYRGYFCYNARQNNDRFSLNTWSTYFHPKSWLQYPMMPADKVAHASSFASIFRSSAFYDLDQVGVLRVNDAK
ncbi:MAG: hypothetical protein IJA58_01365 [Lachnospiraceae bacterium]|nr:hypothetical protein [Lachnospiraceae bacterium]